MNQAEFDAALAQELSQCAADPLRFVRFAYPWGERELAKHQGPRDWQKGVLEEIGAHLANPETRFQPLKLARASGHGIGKSALISWVTDWALSTCSDTKVLITANTEPQLRTKTWPEIGKWFRMSINAHWWNVTNTAVLSRDAGKNLTWRADAATWSENNTEAFAGLHNQGKRLVLIFDEASAIADKVWEVAEGALTDEDTEIIWLVLGNPTRNVGSFRECFGKLKHRWKGAQIDSRNVDGTNKAEISKWVEDYGEDSDFVRIRVRGEFPRAGSTQFIPSDIVAAARKFKAEGFEALPKVMSVDVARFGDDESVVGVRQGRKLTILARYRGLDTYQLGERVIEFLEEEEPDALVIDGDGIGGGTIDHIRNRGFHRRGGRDILHEFHGGAGPEDPATYFNRRVEVWGLMRDWLKAGAEIPDEAALEQDLIGPEYGFDAKGRFQLEKKSDMKARGLNSPDAADMLAMSFAVKVGARVKPKAKTSSIPQHQQAWMA